MIGYDLLSINDTYCVPISLRFSLSSLRDRRHLYLIMLSQSSRDVIHQLCSCYILCISGQSESIIWMRVALDHYIIGINCAVDSHFIHSTYMFYQGLTIRYSYKKGNITNDIFRNWFDVFKLRNVYIRKKALFSFSCTGKRVGLMPSSALLLLIIFPSTLHTRTHPMLLLSNAMRNYISLTLGTFPCQMCFMGWLDLPGSGVGKTR